MEADDKVRVKFVTKLPAFRVTETPIAVPRSLRRYGLSEVINHLLGHKKATPFDILVRGQFLRSSLRQYMERNGVSGEAVLELEYVIAMREPEERVGSQQPDWVGAVAAAGADCFITGGYDGILRIYDDDCKMTSSVAASDQPVVAVAAALEVDGGILCLTGGKDHVAKLWRVSTADTKLQRLATLRSHENTISVTRASHDRLLTADWDGRVNLWAVPSDDNVAEASVAQKGSGSSSSSGSSKKRKLSGGEEERYTEQRPLASFKAHAQVVGGVAWRDLVACTGSWDHSIKVWDMARQDCVHTFNSSKAVTCMDGTGLTGSDGRPLLLASGHPDAAVRIWDPRADAAALTLARAVLESHRQWISGVAWCPDSGHLLASCGHDGVVKLWDVRSNLPLHSTPAHAGKALCLTWRGREIVSGGSDGVVKRFSVT